MLKRIPLGWKTLLITLIAALTASFALDYFHQQKLRGALYMQLVTRLNSQAKEDLIRFDLYAGAYPQAAKLIVSQKRFMDYLETGRPAERGSRVKYYTETPPWMPKPSVIRSLVHFEYAMLLDAHGRPAEIFQNSPDPLPAPLLRPSALLKALSHNQSTATEIEGKLYLITSDSAALPGKAPVTLMLATPLDDDFLSRSLKEERDIVALIRGNEVIASNWPDILPAGVSLESARKQFLVTEKIFEVGTSDLVLYFASFIPRDEAESLTRRLLASERRNDILKTSVLIFVFLLVVLWITQYIRRLTFGVVKFSRDVLGIVPRRIPRGDELVILENQFRDLTDEVISAREKLKKEAEESKTAKDAAEAANRAKSVFLANMSHELRTPLNAVLGFSRLMKRSPDATPGQQESLSIITRSGEHLLNLINNVLDISKIEAGRVELEETGTDLNQILHEIQSLMHVRAQEKGLSFTIEKSIALPRVRIDAGKLRQVLINLIGNAIKYTETGGVIVHAGIDRNIFVRTPLSDNEAPSPFVPLPQGRGVGVRVGPDEQQASLRFEVVDTGPGIAKEDQERIFLPFEQASSRPYSTTGTGLGLTISKQYVEMMGGHIGVESEPGKGSTFHFDVPAKLLPADEHIPAASDYSRIVGLAEGQQKYRILIVEDQPENRLLLRKLLEPLGLDLREAVDGQQAIEAFEAWRPDLIWMDVRMPVMDGLEATRRIKATGAKTRIIALTAHALEDERREILAAGCDDFIRKPFGEQDIFEALSRHLDLKYHYEGSWEPKETAGQEIIQEQLERLPVNLRSRLHQAIVELDTALTLKLIEEIAEKDARVGRVLEALAMRLDYGRLLMLLEPRPAATGNQ